MDHQEMADLLRWIVRHGGRVTVRDLYKRDNHLYLTIPLAQDALNCLVVAGLGSWREQPPGPQGGRPTRFFETAARDPSLLGVVL